MKNVITGIKTADSCIYLLYRSQSSFLPINTFLVRRCTYIQYPMSQTDKCGYIWGEKLNRTPHPRHRKGSRLDEIRMRRRITLMVCSLNQLKTVDEYVTSVHDWEKNNNKKKKEYHHHVCPCPNAITNRTAIVSGLD